MQIAHPRADLLYHADAFMAKDGARFQTFHGSAYEIQVGAADGAGGQAHDGVRILLDGRGGNFVQAEIAYPWNTTAFMVRILSVRLLSVRIL